MLHIYVDGAGESHGREELLTTDTAAAPGNNGLRFQRTPNLQYEYGFIGDVPAGLDNSFHTTPTRRLISFPYGEVCITTSDGVSWHLWPNRIVVAEDTTGKGHVTRTLNGKPAIFMHALLPKDAAVPFASLH